MQAELDVLQTSFFPKPDPIYADATYIKGMLKFYTHSGLISAFTFMDHRADRWREVAQSQGLAEEDAEKVNESQRRAIVCDRAWLGVAEGLIWVHLNASVLFHMNRANDHSNLFSLFLSYAHRDLAEVLAQSMVQRFFLIFQLLSMDSQSSIG